MNKVIKPIPEAKPKVKKAVTKEVSGDTSKPAVVTEQPKEQNLIKVDTIKDALERAKRFPARVKEMDAQVVELEKRVREWGDKEFDSDNKDDGMGIVSDLLHTRTGIDDERKIEVAPYNNTVAIINPAYKKPQDKIRILEAIMKPKAERWKQKVEDEKNEKAANQVKLRDERINALYALGAKYEDGYYVIVNPENEEDTMSWQAVEIQAMSPENWEKAQKLAGEIKEKIATAEADRLEQEAKDKLKRDEAEKKLKEDQEQIINDRFENRKERLQLMGFVEHSGFFVNGNLRECTLDIRQMDNTGFNTTVESLKGAIERSKKQAEYDNRVSRLVQMGFKDEGSHYRYQVNGFKYDIDKTQVADQQKYDFTVSEFTKEKEVYDKEQEVITKRIAIMKEVGFEDFGNGEYKYDDRKGFCIKSSLDFENDEKFEKFIADIKKTIKDVEEERVAYEVQKTERSNKLRDAGMSFVYNDDIFKYVFKSPQGEGRPKEISYTMDEVMKVKELDNFIIEITTVIEQDKIDKVKYDEAQVELKRKSDAEKKTDSQNIVSFTSEVESLAKTVVIRDEDTKALFLKMCNEFSNSIVKIIA